MDPPPPRSERRRRREYLLALEEERRKIQVFQRELPLCLELVTQSTSRASLSRSGRRLARLPRARSSPPVPCVCSVGLTASLKRVRLVQLLRG